VDPGIAHDDCAFLEQSFVHSCGGGLCLDQDELLASIKTSIDRVLKVQVEFRFHIAEQHPVGEEIENAAIVAVVPVFLGLSLMTSTFISHLLLSYVEMSFSRLQTQGFSALVNHMLNKISDIF